MTERIGTGSWRWRSSCAASEWVCSGSPTTWASAETRLLLLVGVWSVAAATSIALSSSPMVLLIRNAWTPLILAAVLLLAAYGPGRRHLPEIVSSALALMVVDALWQLSTGTDVLGFPKMEDRISGPLPHPNDLALVALLVPFARWWAWPSALALVVGSGSRNAMLGLVVAGFVMAPPKVRLALVSTILVGVVAVTTLTPADAFTRGTGRIGHWLVALDMAKGAPVVGHGPGSFPDHYLPRLDRLRPLPWGLEAEISFIPWAHNLYLEQLAERGILGLGVFLLPLGIAWRRGSRSVRAAVAAFAVMGIMDLTFLKPWVVGAYWGLVVLSQGEA